MTGVEVWNGDEARSPALVKEVLILGKGLGLCQCRLLELNDLTGCRLCEERCGRCRCLSILRCAAAAESTAASSVTGAYCIGIASRGRLRAMSGLRGYAARHKNLISTINIPQISHTRNVHDRSCSEAHNTICLQPPLPTHLP